MNFTLNRRFNSLRVGRFYPLKEVAATHFKLPTIDQGDPKLFNNKYLLLPQVFRAAVFIYCLKHQGDHRIIAH